MAQEEQYVFFWGNSSPFSQWYPCTFTVDDVEYCCAEQYMMHQKAVLFGDDQTAKRIMDTHNPKEQKALGRQVKSFDAKVWNEQCRDIVEKGNVAKFSQNLDLKRAIFETTGSVLVEASPRDTIWGIGLGAGNPKAKNKSTWRGKNWLGYVLTNVRKKLMADTEESAT
ncbi:NADAR domain-containing protein [Lamellibrachia satsuma]|nr:NADAR domain-containing protein [Lamellibrachia satsuma]